jgi:hypothetical protein
MSQLLEDGSPRRYYCGTTSSQTKPHSCGSLPGAWSFGSSRRERSWHRSWHTRPTGASVRAGKSLSCRTFGAVAQLGEHLLCKQGVAGSIPVRSTPSEVSFRQWIGSIMGSAAVGGPAVCAHVLRISCAPSGIVQDGSRPRKRAGWGPGPGGIVGRLEAPGASSSQPDCPTRAGSRGGIRRLTGAIEIWS